MMRLSLPVDPAVLPVGAMVGVLDHGQPSDLTLTRRTERTWLLAGVLPDGTHLPPVYDPSPVECLSAAVAYAATVKASRRWFL